MNKFISSIFAQLSLSPSQPLVIDGTWKGFIRVGNSEIQMSVCFLAEPELQATIKIPAQGVKDLPLRQVRLKGKAVRFELPAGSTIGYFKGKISDGSIQGTFRQGRSATSFELRKGKVNQDNLAAIMDEIKQLPGSISLTCLQLGDEPIMVAELAPDLPLAIGSSFKLYILGALIDEILAQRSSWETIVYLAEEYRSLPAGILQDWPSNAPLTLYSLAALMIAISDNTATDHLLFYLGRDRVEAALTKMHHQQSELMIPLLATFEIFTLKYSPDQQIGLDYIQADLASKRDLLEKIQEQPRGQINTLEPCQIDQLEWFASTKDLCMAMNWLREKTELESVASGREILAIEKQLMFSDEIWDFVGFKGGSEPGVVNFTFLLQHVQGAWYALSATWNNPNGSLKQENFVSLLQRFIDVLEISNTD
jgi:Beta-lactamase enzyme family